MQFEYHVYDKELPDTILIELKKLHQVIFNTSEDLEEKMSTKSNVQIIVAISDGKVIGYKIGYAIDKHIFYSWLGGVDPEYRGHGIASKLMDKQHQVLKELDYKIVRTKTMNKWRNMLILNIKNGFDITEVLTEDDGTQKIVLEKRL